MVACAAQDRAPAAAHNPPIRLSIQPTFVRDFPLLLGLLSAPLPSPERPGEVSNALRGSDARLVRIFMLPKSPGMHPIPAPGYEGRITCGIDETGTTSS